MPMTAHPSPSTETGIPALEQVIPLTTRQRLLGMAIYKGAGKMPPTLSESREEWPESDPLAAQSQAALPKLADEQSETCDIAPR